MRSVQSAFLILALVIASIAIAPTTRAQGVAGVRLVHALPDAPKIALYANGQPLIDDLDFAGVSEYDRLEPGTYQFQVVVGGTDINAAPALEATVAAGTFYTVAATGLLPNIRLTVFVDNLSAPASGRASGHVYHLSPDAPAIDLTIKDGAKLVYNLPFPGVSNYFTVGADHYHLQILPATVKGPVLIDLPDADLEAGKITDIFIIGPLVAMTTKVTQTSLRPPPAVPATLPRTEGTILPLTAIISLAVLFLVYGISLRIARSR